jgi:predicted CopG family antitoxin
VKRDVLIHVKLDTYVKLSELKARLRKKSFDGVIKELVKAFESGVAFTSGEASEADASKVTGVASVTAGESGYTPHIGVEIMSEEEAKARGITEPTGTDSSTAPSTAKQSSGTSQYRKKLYRMRYEDGDESWLLQYAPEDWEKE